MHFAVRTNVGASISRIGFWRYHTLELQSSIGNHLGPYSIFLFGASVLEALLGLRVLNLRGSRSSGISCRGLARGFPNAKLGGVSRGLHGTLDGKLCLRCLSGDAASGELSSQESVFQTAPSN